jgi:hypothetical protein
MMIQNLGRFFEVAPYHVMSVVGRKEIGSILELIYLVLNS